MSDEDKKITGDDEYQFPNEEYIMTDESSADELGAAPEAHEAEAQAQADAYDEPVQERRSLTERLPFLRNKRVLLIVGVLLVAVVAFQFLKPSKEVIQSQPAVVQTQEAPTTVQAQPSSQVLSEITNLKQDAANNNASVSQLQSQIEQLRGDLQNSQAQNQQLVNTLQALQEQLQQLNNKVDKLEKPKKIVRKKTRSLPHIAYHLKAIEPGRAWIQDQDGRSQTIRVGDELQQYGTVLAIDAERGDVITSSGKLITYGANDS